MTATGKRVQSMAELKLVKRAIDHQARALDLHQAKIDAERVRAHTRSVGARELFRRAAGAVQPLPDQGRVPLRQTPPAPIPMQRLRDERAVLREAISDDFDAGTLLDTDERLSYRRQGIGADVADKLRRGKWSIQRQLDLHGLRSDDARDALAAFLRESCKQGVRCVRVVHGKGLGSPGKAPVLKNKVHGWLAQRSEVLAFVQARPLDGGAGALVVLLRPGS